MSLTLKLALSPLLAVQALQVRARTPRLPEAAGPRQGTAAPPGAGRRGRDAEPLRLLVAGDSSAAGVGVAHQRDALALPLARRLAAALGRPVHWRLLARSGLGSAQLLAWLREELQREAALREGPAYADLAVLVSGVNDVVEQVPSQRAAAAREALANHLRNGWGVRQVLFTPLPPVQHFPALPPPLRWVAGHDARRHDAALRRWAATRAGDVGVADLRELSLNPATMADDGFHPGAPAYRWLAHALAEHLAGWAAGQRRPA